MRTYFAPAERAGAQELKKDRASIAKDPIIGEILNAVGGLLAVLNEQRQILFMNENLLYALNIGNAERILGLRLGEAVGCIHAEEPPSGCGTTEYCSTCGAAIAMVTCAAEQRPVEKMCTIVSEREGKVRDYYFQVRCSPVILSGRRSLLLFIQDTTVQQRWAALERVFFHDISNLIMYLENATELLEEKGGDPDLDRVHKLHQCAERLAREIEIQKAMVRMDIPSYSPVRRKLNETELIDDIRTLFFDHPAADGKSLRLCDGTGGISFETDAHLLLRILENMTVNALEATEEGGEVRFWIEHEERVITFCVWNGQAIPEPVRKRVFQRNVSTKEGSGRGLGTYSMKFFGEEVLGGRVDFTTSESEGTVFRFRLPLL